MMVSGKCKATGYSKKIHFLHIINVFEAINLVWYAQLNEIYVQMLFINELIAYWFFSM